MTDAPLSKLRYVNEKFRVIELTSNAVNVGRIGDGALPNSTLVPIDRDTLEATVVLIPAPFDGGQRPPNRYIATIEDSTLFATLVGFAPEMTGTEVASWIGDVRVDIDETDQLFARVIG